MEAECELFPKMADAVGLSPSISTLPLDDARPFAEALMRCASADEAKKLMLAQRTGAQAFWQVMDVVLLRVRSEKIRPGVPPMSATGPLAVLACTVLEYCEAADQRLPNTF